MADIVAILRSRAESGLKAHGQAWCDGMRAAANIVAGQHARARTIPQELRDAVVGELEQWVETAGEDPVALADSIIAAIDHARGPITPHSGHLTLVEAIEKMATLLGNGEWAELLITEPPALVQLEAEITQLVGWRRFMQLENGVEVFAESYYSRSVETGEVVFHRLGVDQRPMWVEDFDSIVATGKPAQRKEQL